MRKIAFGILFIFGIVSAYCNAELDQELLNAYGNLPLMKELLEKGASPDTINSGGSIIIDAAMWGDYDVVKLLLEYGADPNSQSPGGYTALILSIGDTMGTGSTNDVKILKLLLQYKADPNLDADTLTPLINTILKYKILTKEELQEAVRALIDAGANIGYVDSYKKTAIDYARDKKLFDIVAILENAKSHPRDPSFNYRTTVNLRVRSTSDLSSQVITTLPEGTKVKILETGRADTINDIKGNWVKVESETGTTGWCFNGYLAQ